MSFPLPIVWSIAGNDSGGGAGLSADQRAAAAFNVHLCPVVAAVTAQNSIGVLRVVPTSPDVLEAQLAALADDILPAVVKTGMLGSPENVLTVAHWVDKLRERGPVALVIDPVMGASTGALFASEAVLAAYREHLLPRATLLTPNESEARRLATGSVGADATIPELARALREAGAESVAITCGDNLAQQSHSLDWIDTPHASGWLSLPRVDTPHNHGTGCTFASSAASAMARGFVAADALVLAKMATTQALRHGYAAGKGAGPVSAHPGFAVEPSLMPWLSWGETPVLASESCANESQASSATNIGLYAIVDTAERVEKVVAAGVKTVQLRIKTPSEPDDAWRVALREAVLRSKEACQLAGARLVINDHWQLAHELGVRAVHLGQEDLLALGDAGRAALSASGLQVGISSHSLWELARGRGLNPPYVACGPVWPTLTKAMPWHAQGLDNLAWWVHMAGVPVVAIGGILVPEQLTQAAQSGADGVCVVRGLGDEPATTIPVWEAALEQGRRAAPLPVPEFPHPSLDLSPRLAPSANA